MIRRRLNTINFSLRVITFLLPPLAFALAAYLRFLSGLIPVVKGHISITDYIGLLFFTTVIWAFVVDHYRLFRFDQIHRTSGSAWNIFCGCCVTYVAVMSATFFYRSISFSRLFVTISALILFFLSVLAEDGLRALLQRAKSRAGSIAQVLIVGADQFAVDTARTLLKGMPMPTRIVAFVRLPGQQSAPEAIPVIDLCDVAQTSWTRNLDDVVLALPTSQFAGIPAIMKQMERLCVPVRAVLDLGKNVAVREILFEFGGLRLLDLRASPSESALYLVVKRSCDLIFC
jgi:FlaA1/EpsC-like NDP-sugar epimerase